ncbi:hypothetical protein [Streptomyces sp. NPDC008240]|uniref:hypothetical protein n=1 Tax=Streptomyces sp. NPDC008240 TaxID=3364822 RepID=UPI0036EE29A2
MTLTDEVALYTALATVAAITTALQASVALLLISQDDDVRKRKRRSTEGDQDWNDAKRDAGRYFWTGAPLNILTLLVSGTVLASWGGVLESFCSKDSRWYLSLPFIAVLVIWFVLLVVVIVYLARVRNARK